MADGIVPLATLLGFTLSLATTPSAQGGGTNSLGAWDVVSAGAVGDGTTDCTTAFQKALDEAGRAGGGVVHVPAGRYRIEGNLRIPAGVTLQGTFRVPPTVRQATLDSLQGSVLLAYAGRGTREGPPFIQLAGSAACVAGIIVFYPEWKQTDVPPVPYPPCIASQDTENVGVLDCCLVNPYEGIHFVRAHRHLVRNVTGYPIKRGLFVDECYDIGHIENIHFWPFGVLYKPEDPYCEWINTQGVAFELARTDWHYVSNTFCFGYGTGYLFSESKAGSTNGNFLGLGADCCERAVVVEQAQPPGLLITNGEFVGRWGSKSAVCLEIGEKVAGSVSLSNCSFWGPIDRCVWMRAPRGQFTASACNFVQWDVNRRHVPAIQLDAGRSIIQGCTFSADGDLHVAVGTAVASAILVGNQADRAFVFENAAGTKVQAFANQQEPVSWTNAAKGHYRLTIGEEGDGRYLRRWYGRDILPEGSPRPRQRWSAPDSEFVLPVIPGKRYTVTLDAHVPPPARSADAGLYLGAQRLIDLSSGGMGPWKGVIPATKGDSVRLQVRCKGWIPKQENPQSLDDRTLGIAGFSITLRAQGASSRLFNANTGAWEEASGDGARPSPRPSR